MQTAVDELNCTDIAADSPIWIKFWDDYPGIMTTALGLTNISEIAELRATAESFKSAGCSVIAADAEGEIEYFTQTSFCDGHESFWSPLSMLCPASCCTAESEYCPSSCSCLDNDKDSESVFCLASKFGGLPERRFCLRLRRTS